MTVVRGYPPNFEEIAAALPEASGPGTVFCYGDRIYNPGGGRIGAALRAHEAVHSSRQGSTDASIREWWSKYIADPAFRLNEELPAHQAEYRVFCANEKAQGTRFRFLVALAMRLSGPLYGGLIEFTAAKRSIKNEARA